MAFYDTADANAEATDVKNGKIVYVKGVQITGTADVYVSGTTLYVPEGWLVPHEV